MGLILEDCENLNYISNKKIKHMKNDNEYEEIDNTFIDKHGINYNALLLYFIMAF